MNQEVEDRAEDQAKAQLQSIGEMLAAVAVDYDRLHELKDDFEQLQGKVQEACEEVDDADMEQSAARRDGEPFDNDALADACEALEAWEEDLYQFGRENAEELKELKDLIEAAGDCESEEDARQRIQEDPLSVQIRSGWYSPGEEPEPEEFEILLCTGGPAVRILGELNEHHEPSRAWLEYQDWGTPWTSYYEAGADATLVEYAQHFYFGD